LREKNAAKIPAGEVCNQMKIWVDADACPAVIKDILYRAAERAEVPLTLVANRNLQIPNSPRISLLKVASGFDVADNEIVRRAAAGDLVVTGDIPLAAGVIEKGAHALSPRGELYTPDVTTLPPPEQDHLLGPFEWR
jgi:uncharacterized protein YaiI (UPF0178 family)